MGKEKTNVIFGECRCCMQKGHHKDLMKDYYREDTRENYLNIFVECYNLYLLTNTKLSTLICEECAGKLKDAYNFKTLVVNTEKRMLAAIKDCGEGTEFINVTSDTIVEIKEEIVCDAKGELSDMDIEEDNDNDVDASSGYGDHDFGNLVEGEASLLARFTPGKLKMLPTRDNLHNMCPEYVKELDSLKDKTITAGMIESILHTDRKKERKKKDLYNVKEKIAHIINVSTLLENCNAIAFKTKLRCGYPCFYCGQRYFDLKELREHQPKHAKSLISKILSKYTCDTLVVYAEITNLKCSICHQNIPDLNELKSHLIKEHAKKMYTDFSDRVIPFKYKQEGFECQVCHFNFETFGAIEKHMNYHYRNYVCDQCGTGFVTNHRLKVHVKSQHNEGNFPCGECKKVYTSALRLKTHLDVVHKMKRRNKCPHCLETFIDYFTRQKHMVEVHDVKPIFYKCNVCEHTFSRRYGLTTHLKRCHLEQKDVKCAHCNYKCFSQGQLRAHMLKHGGEKVFECSVCKKSYARKKTLKEHMRIHNNDRRFKCCVCEQAFVQNCSLKGHMKTHHREYLEARE